MPISTELVKAFVVLCQVKSYSETAKILRRSQPTISNRIRLLEDQVGFPLFKDKTPHSGLTARAELLYQRCLKIQNELDQISVLAHAQVGKVIRIGVSPCIERLCPAGAILNPSLARSDITISMSTDSTENLLAAVEKGAIDACYICSQDVPGPLVHKSWPFDIRWIAGQDADIDGLLARPTVPIVGWIEQWQPAHVFSSYFHKAPFQFRTVYQTLNLCSYLEAVRAGIGLGYVGDIFLQDMAKTGKLQFLDDRLAPFGQFFIHRLNHSTPAANVQKILDTIDHRLDTLCQNSE